MLPLSSLPYVRIIAYNKKFVQPLIFLSLANIDSLARMVDLSLMKSMKVWRRTSVKGTSWEKISQMSIRGSFPDKLMNKVVRTRRAVRFTVTTASKKKGFTKLVAYTITRIKTLER